MYDYDITAGSDCQLERLVSKLKPRKEWALRAAPWLAKHVSVDQQARYAHCGDHLTMLADESLTKRKIETAYFCGLRLCPGCAWRASLRSAAAVSAISQQMIADGYIMLMITLTIPNVPASGLRDACLELNAAYHRLMRRKAYTAWQHNIRKLEITYNAQRDDYHPHIHAIVYVQPGYFATNRGCYVSRARLLADWRAATGNDSITQVDIRRCRDRDTGSNAILEVSKYCAKASDYTQSESVYDTMYATLYHLRIMTYSGRCKALKADYDAGRLDHLLPSDDTRYVYRLIYRYYAGLGYVQTDTTPYTPPTPPGFGQLVGEQARTPWDITAEDVTEVV